METLVKALIQYPVLTLFVVIGLGFWLGELSYKGFKLGVSGVLFMGLAVGALSPKIALPEIIPSLGLIIFVYCVGIHSGPEFLRMFKQRGLRDSVIAVCMISLAAVLSLILAKVFALSGAYASGLFCGGLTNTPALAAVREMLSDAGKHAGLGGEQLVLLVSRPVVAYSIAYPLGVLGIILGFQFLKWLWKVELPKAQAAAKIECRNFVVANPGVFGESVSAVLRLHSDHNFIISRVLRSGEVELVDRGTVLQEGDVISVVAEEGSFQVAEQIFGPESDTNIEQDRSEFDYRRFFVSHVNAVGKKIRDIGLHKKYSGVITRVQRDDTEMVATAETVLEYGDRVRVVCPVENFEAIREFFGDSIKSTAEADFRALAIGMVLGVLVGLIPINLFGMEVRLGIAGGPLVVALVLGYLRRTWGLCWVMPISANLTLRHIGLLLFLGGVGTRAGYEFIHTLQTEGLVLLFAGAIVTFVSVLLTIYIGYRRLKLPFDYVMGLVAGIHTQPAALGFATTHAHTDAPNVGYASVYPAATIAKIIWAQIILALGGGLMF